MCISAATFVTFSSPQVQSYVSVPLNNLKALYFVRLEKKYHR